MFSWLKEKVTGEPAATSSENSSSYESFGNTGNISYSFSVIAVMLSLCSIVVHEGCD